MHSRRSLSRGALNAKSGAADAQVLGPLLEQGLRDLIQGRHDPRYLDLDRQTARATMGGKPPCGYMPTR